MSDLIDLNVFVGPPRKVKLGETIYLLPRDIPVELYLEILDMQARPEDLDEEQIVRKLYQDVLGLFRVHQPDMERLPPATSIAVLVQMVGHVYSGAADAEERPTRAKAKATASRGTPSRKKTATRSRSSRS